MFKPVIEDSYPFLLKGNFLGHSLFKASGEITHSSVLVYLVWLPLWEQFRLFEEYAHNNETDRQLSEIKYPIKAEEMRNIFFLYL